MAQNLAVDGLYDSFETFFGGRWRASLSLCSSMKSKIDVLRYSMESWTPRRSRRPVNRARSVLLSASASFAPMILLFRSVMEKIQRRFGAGIKMILRFFRRTGRRTAGSRFIETKEMHWGRLKGPRLVVHDTGFCFWNREGREMLKRKPPAQPEQLVPDARPVDRARVSAPSADDHVSDSRHSAPFIRNLVRSAGLAGVGYCKC